MVHISLYPYSKIGYTMHKIFVSVYDVAHCHQNAGCYSRTHPQVIVRDSDCAIIIVRKNDALNGYYLRCCHRRSLSMAILHLKIAYCDTCL